MLSQYAYVYQYSNMFASYREKSHIHNIKSFSSICTGNSRLASASCNVIRCLRHIFFVTITQLINATVLNFAPLFQPEYITSLCFTLRHCPIKNSSRFFGDVLQRMGDSCRQGANYGENGRQKFSARITTVAYLCSILAALAIGDNLAGKTLVATVEFQLHQQGILTAMK